jgi:hypothetical protein
VTIASGIPTNPYLIDSLSTLSDATNRTWFQYAQYLFIRRTECSLTAAMLIWWIAGIFKRTIYATARTTGKPKQNIIEQVYSFFDGKISINK